MIVNRRNAFILIGGGLAIAAGFLWSGVRRMGSMQDYDAAMATLRAPLPDNPEPSDLIRFATLAANSHNTQGWRFVVAQDRIDILPDPARATPVVDPDSHHLFVSLGCAAENLVIAAASRGLQGEALFDPAAGSVRFDYAKAGASDAALSDAIPQRQSTRALYDGSRLTAAELGVLAGTVRGPGVDLVLITEPGQMGRIADLVARGNSAQIADPAFMQELKLWLRFNPHRAMATGDGLFSATTGNPAMPDWLGPTVLDWAYTAEDENTKNSARIASSAGMAVFVGAKDDPEHWVLAGRACQRFALQATALGLKHAFMNQPVEVPDLRPELAALVGMPGRRPDLVMRFGRAAVMPFSARRPTNAVMA